jgi:hypothetical protein
MELPPILWFIGVGFIGGLTYVIMAAESWDDFKKFSSHKRLMLGAVIGFLYYYLHSDYNFPNAVMTWVAAYAGPAFVDNLISKYKGLKG